MDNVHSSPLNLQERSNKLNENSRKFDKLQKFGVLRLVDDTDCH